MYYPGAPLDGPFQVASHIDWGREEFIRVESRYPLPLNIKNLVPEIIYGTD